MESFCDEILRMRDASSLLIPSVSINSAVEEDSTLDNFLNRARRFLIFAGPILSTERRRNRSVNCSKFSLPNF